MLHGLASVLVERAPKLVFPSLEHSHSRLCATPDDDRGVAVVLPHGTVMRGSDVLAAESGTLVEVQAAPEYIPHMTNNNRLALVHAAYRFGSRHTLVQVSADALQLEADPVPGDMLILLGVIVAHVEVLFEPEAGAYDGGHRHGHDVTFEEDYTVVQVLYHERHKHDHSHSYAHGRNHNHSYNHDHGHIRGSGCGHHHHHHD